MDRKSRVVVILPPDLSVALEQERRSIPLESPQKSVAQVARDLMRDGLRLRKLQGARVIV